MTGKTSIPRRILLDINLLFNDFLFRNPTYARSQTNIEIKNRLFANQAMNYIRQQRHFNTFVADFSVAKMISLMDSIKVKRDMQIEEIQSLVDKNTIVSLGGNLIKNTLEEFKNNPFVKDMENALQFTVSRKHKCTHIITFNKKDFDPFDVQVVFPSKVRGII
jgi:predicted nucleic acid-binding protein